MYLLFCDGSIKDNKMGLGVIVCDTLNNDIELRVKNVLYIHKAIYEDLNEVQLQQYEFFSILEGFKLLHVFNDQPAIIFNDCSNTIELLESLTTNPLRKFKYKDFFVDKLGIPNCRFQWLPRKNKAIAFVDKLSKPQNQYFGASFTLSEFSQYENELKKISILQQNFQDSLNSYLAQNI